MTYDSTISFTIDTCCPWTYLARRRLSKALAQFTTKHPNAPIRFAVKYLPYQLYPEASKEGEDKYEWYKREKYGSSEEQMKKYMLLMGSYGNAEGIDFKFGGRMANTLDAHRLIWWVQETKGAGVAEKAVDCMRLTCSSFWLD
jgi:predicted DsbA family dithiol-disulfide isomerase